MTIQNIKDFYAGFGISSALISNWTTLSEHKAGKIHLFQETLDRYLIVGNSLAFSMIALEKLSYLRIVNQLQSKPIKWAIWLTPIALGYLKHRTQKTYPLLAKNLSYLENCIDKSAYATFIIGSVALVRFGHLFTGYAVLSAFVFNQIISSGFAKSHLPLLKKVDSVFKKYFNPILGLAAVAASGNYLTIGYSLFSLALITHASFAKPTYTIQKPQANTQDSSSNRLTLEKWKEFNTKKQDTFLTINRERIPRVGLPSLNAVIDARQYISDILNTLPENLQKDLIDRIKRLPRQIKQQYTFEDAKLIAISHLDKLIAFTKESSNPLWNTLLQQSCFILQQLNDKPNEQLSSIKELLFGNEGQCEVAQQRNILSGFLLLQTKANIDIELKFNLSLESLSSENFRYFLEAHFERSFSILEKAKMGFLSSLLRNRVNLTDMHTYQAYEKSFGPHFGIHPIAEDLVTESSNVSMMSNNPFLYILMKCLLTLPIKDHTEAYFATQLLKITPWLSSQIALKQLFILVYF